MNSFRMWSTCSSRTSGTRMPRSSSWTPSAATWCWKSGSGEIGARLLEMNYRLPRGMGVVGYAVETATPFVTNNVNAVMFFFRNPLLPDTQSEITVPIQVDGQVVGVLDIQDKPPRRLTEDDLRLMSAVADQLSVALQKASLYANLQTALQQEQSVRTQLVQSERLALVGRLLASVSHELNNPLQAIQNALFLLKDEEHLSADGQTGPGCDPVRGGAHGIPHRTPAWRLPPRARPGLPPWSSSTT
ncbi:MAG: GAF domain-containing protein [Ignavibacteriales bacterium]|nr:GAF domain-containing protein [Ignavibacteriales bacterium]